VRESRSGRSNTRAAVRSPPFLFPAPLARSREETIQDFALSSLGAPPYPRFRGQGPIQQRLWYQLNRQEPVRIYSRRVGEHLEFSSDPFTEVTNFTPLVLTDISSAYRHLQPQPQLTIWVFYGEFLDDYTFIRVAELPDTTAPGQIPASIPPLLTEHRLAGRSTAGRSSRRDLVPEEIIHPRADEHRGIQWPTFQGFNSASYTGGPRFFDAGIRVPHTKKSRRYPSNLHSSLFRENQEEAKGDSIPGIENDCPRCIERFWKQKIYRRLQIFSKGAESYQGLIRLISECDDTECVEDSEQILF
jgi:hypothetical protein